MCCLEGEVKTGFERGRGRKHSGIWERKDKARYLKPGGWVGGWINRPLQIFLQIDSGAEL